MNPPIDMETLMKRRALLRHAPLALLASGLAAVSLSAFAQAPLPLVDGEVRKVDIAQQKITLRHAEIPNLDMSPMTMVFRVKEPALLVQVQPGDKVRFTADKVDGALTAMTIERAN
jgi:Cu(I)/Ag(I) efflux system protein CusF